MVDCSHAQIACRLATAGFAARVAAPIKGKLSREVLNYASLERLLNEKKNSFIRSFLTVHKLFNLFISALWK